MDFFFTDGRDKGVIFPWAFFQAVVDLKTMKVVTTTSDFTSMPRGPREVLSICSRL